MSKKSARITAMIEKLQGSGMDAHYIGYFECFNQGLFYEAHDVLEELWLAERGQRNDAFYKGLIQLTGAFVHLQKGRLQPAGSLFRLARGNLSQYAARHERLDVAQVLRLIEDWLGRLSLSGENPLTPGSEPTLNLEAAGS